MASLKKRGGIYYEQYYVGDKNKLVSLRTPSLQTAKEKLRQQKSAGYRGEETVMPTRTPTADVVGKFVRNMPGKKRARNGDIADGYTPVEGIEHKRTKIPFDAPPCKIRRHIDRGLSPGQSAKSN
jgi:hypothetical protein